METSRWKDESELPRFSGLQADIDVDVAVVGGGNTGITAAYLLKRAGVKVAVLEKGSIARIDTGNTTAHLTQVTDARLESLIKVFGEEHAQAVWDAGAAAIEKIHQIVHAEKINCDFSWVPGYLHCSDDTSKHQQEKQELEEEARLARRFGFEAQIVPSIPVFHRFGIRFPRQAKFEPLQYLAALARTIPGDGCYLFENSEVTEFEDEPIRLKVGNHTVTCGKVIIATDVPLTGLTPIVSASLLQTKLAAYTSFAISASLPKSEKVLPALFWDTADPYYFLRIDRSAKGVRAVYGGLDRKTGQPIEEDPFVHLQSKLNSLFPGATMDHSWQGQVIEAVDGLPYIGPTTENQFIATAFSGNGITFGTLAGMMACDYVLGSKNPWSELFHPDRKKLRAGWNYIKENIDYPYYMMKERLFYKEGRSLENIAPGEGKIVLLEGERVAAYRAHDGTVTKLSPVCTHLGCLVHWNAFDSSWDCPCHGSRFRPTGEVFAGPAETNLEKKED